MFGACFQECRNGLPGSWQESKAGPQSLFCGEERVGFGTAYVARPRRLALQLIDKTSAGMTRGVGRRVLNLA